MPAPSIATESAPASKSVMSEFGQSKRCSKCIERLPLSAFRRQRAGKHGRHAECNRCRNLRESPLVAGKRRAARRRELLRRLERITAMRCQRRYAALLEDTISHFGGTERLAEEFRAVFDAARERGDLKTASHILLAIGRLCQQSDSLRKISLASEQSATTTTHRVSKPQHAEKPDLSQLSDADLAANVRRLKREACFLP